MYYKSQFSFACPSDSLVSQFNSTPLVLDLIVKSDEHHNDKCGMAVITLQKCLNFKPVNDKIAVMAQNKLIGSLDVKYWVENKVRIAVILTACDAFVSLNLISYST